MTGMEISTHNSVARFADCTCCNSLRCIYSNNINPEGCAWGGAPRFSSEISGWNMIRWTFLLFGWIMGVIFCWVLKTVPLAGCIIFGHSPLPFCGFLEGGGQVLEIWQRQKRGFQSEVQATALAHVSAMCMGSLRLRVIIPKTCWKRMDVVVGCPPLLIMGTFKYILD